MALTRLAQVAAIGALIIAGLQYYDVEPNALDEMPEQIKSSAEDDVKIALPILNKDDYINEQSSAYGVYKAALIIPHSTEKGDALEKAAMLAVGEGDFKLAINAAANIPNSNQYDDVLKAISFLALKKRDTAGFATIAAELMRSSYNKRDMVKNIISYYEYLADGGVPEKYFTRPKSQLEMYKEVYTFADDVSQIGLSEAKAKIFSDSWFKERNYNDFLYFKDVFKFADDSARMGMYSKDAVIFAFMWIDKYTADDFLVFKEAYQFANSSENMDMNDRQAQDFAFARVQDAMGFLNKK